MKIVFLDIFNANWEIWQDMLFVILIGAVIIIAVFILVFSMLSLIKKKIKAPFNTKIQTSDPEINFSLSYQDILDYIHNLQSNPLCELAQPNIKKTPSVNFIEYLMCNDRCFSMIF